VKSSRPYLPEALAASGLFLACWGLVHTWFWSRHQLVDWPTYHDYGTAMWDDGRVPYRDFAVEYPPGALPVFVVPAPFGDYASAFAWLMAGCGVALVGVVAAIRREAAWYAALAPVLVGSLILSRFDLWPTLLLVAALGALVHGRERLGWSLLGGAVAAKLWPLVVVPLALVRAWRRGSLEAALWGAAVVVGVFVPFAVVAPGGLWHSIEGQASRPLQIESLGASLFTTFGHPAVITTHGSQNVAGHGAVAALLSLVEIAALVALWLAFARGDDTDARLLRFAAACVCAFVALGKVLSPQYLLWLIPLVPLVRGVRGAVATGVLTLACVLTQIWFPQRYFRYVETFHLAPVVLARDLLLVALLLVLAIPSRPRRESPRSA
jgi:uncharacterized membrane protein